METAVYSIAEAVEQLVRQRPPSTIPHPVDVLGIVTGEVVVTTGHHRCTTIEIVDETSSALVTLRHHHDARPLPRVGDLCRFNRVGLPRDRRRYSTPCLPHFRYYPWDDVEDGLDWFCLGRVRDGRLVVSKSAMTMIPNPMRTDAGQIQRLVQWYSHSPIATTWSPPLSQLPHRPIITSFEELLTCVGSTGDIVARVAQWVDPAVPAKTNQRSQHRPTGYAVLAPHTAVTASSSVLFVTLCLTEPRWVAALRRACDTQCPVRLGHVRSEKNVRQDTVLVLTAASWVTLLPAVKHYYCDGNYTTSQRSFLRDWTPSATQTSAAGLDTMHFEAYMTAIQSVHGPSDTGEDMVESVFRQYGQATTTTQQQEAFEIHLAGVEIGQMTVQAGRRVVWQLMGGCSKTSQDNLLTTTAKSFLLALLRYKTRLHWEVQGGQDTWEVVAVSLRHLH